MDWRLVVVGAYVAMSGITIVLYGYDKWRAKRAKGRVAESTLHLAELLGGWPGALLAMRIFHHKNHKKSFLVVLFLIVLLHLVAWGAWVWWPARPAP